ncbi:MAG: dephospho-CoA kinase [Candidatus Zipacnadales bacterium]
MVALAIVGPIASGKSTVLKLLKKYGVATCSADDIAHQLTEVGKPEFEQILAEFGECYRQEDGALDRAALARLIFRSDEARTRLEELLHPAILSSIRAWLEQLRSSTQPPLVAAVEVLRLPSHLSARQLFDVVWLCMAPEAIRRDRLRKRDNLPETEVRQRFEVQRRQQIEICNPDFVIDTNCSLKELEHRVRKALARLPDIGLPDVPHLSSCSWGEDASKGGAN